MQEKPVIHYLDDNLDVTDGPTSEDAPSEITDVEDAAAGTLTGEVSGTLNSTIETQSDQEEEQAGQVFEFSVDHTESNDAQESEEQDSGEVYEPLPPVIRDEEAEHEVEAASEEQPPSDPDDYMNSQLEKTRERIQKLRELSYNFKMRNSEDISRFEKEPAYKRRNVELKDVPDASRDEVSRYTLSSDKDNKPEIKPNNSFLHDKVD